MAGVTQQIFWGTKLAQSFVSIPTITMTDDANEEEAFERNMSSMVGIDTPLCASTSAKLESSDIDRSTIHSGKKFGLYGRAG
jgi:hypothetical protein